MTSTANTVMSSLVAFIGLLLSLGVGNLLYRMRNTEEEVKADRLEFDKNLGKLRDSFDGKLKRQDDRFFALLETFTKKTASLQHCEDVQEIFHNKIDSAAQLKSAEYEHLIKMITDQSNVISDQSIVISKLNECVHKIEKKILLLMQKEGT